MTATPPSFTGEEEIALLVLLPERRVFHQALDLVLDGRALLLEEVVDGAAEAGVDDPVGREGWDRKIAALNLVVALGAGLDALQAVGDGVVDRLVVAGLEMQEGVALQAAPVAAIERVVALKVERAADRAAVGLGHHQHDLVGHGRAEDVEGGAWRVRRAPLAA